MKIRCIKGTKFMSISINRVLLLNHSTKMKVFCAVLFVSSLVGHFPKKKDFFIVKIQPFDFQIALAYGSVSSSNAAASASSFSFIYFSSTYINLLNFFIQMPILLLVVVVVVLSVSISGDHVFSSQTIIII